MAAPSVRVLFSSLGGSKGHDHPFYRESIERATDGEVETIFLDDITGKDDVVNEAAQRSDIIITTLNHAEEVKALFARLHDKIVVIGATIDSSLLLEIARLKQGSHVAFVCLGKIGGEWMASRIREAGISDLHFETIGLNERESFNVDAQGLDKIYASTAVVSELKKMYPDKTELFPMKLEQSSENLLYELASQTKSRGS